MHKMVLYVNIGRRRRLTGATRRFSVGIGIFGLAENLVDQAYEVILDALSDGTFKPGERLTQENIAARLNVSRQP